MFGAVVLLCELFDFVFTFALDVFIVVDGCVEPFAMVTP